MKPTNNAHNNKLPQLVSVDYVGGYVIHVRFDDKREGNIDLSAELWGEIFEPLKDLQVFTQFRLDAELGTVVWPNGADLAPEFLYDKAQ